MIIFDNSPPLGRLLAVPIVSNAQRHSHRALTRFCPLHFFVRQRQSITVSTIDTMACRTNTAVSSASSQRSVSRGVSCPAVWSMAKSHHGSRFDKGSNSRFLTVPMCPSSQAPHRVIAVSRTTANSTIVLTRAGSRQRYTRALEPHASHRRSTCTTHSMTGNLPWHPSASPTAPPGAHQPKHTPRKLESAAGITRLHQSP